MLDKSLYSYLPSRPWYRTASKSARQSIMSLPIVYYSIPPLSSPIHLCAQQQDGNTIVVWLGMYKLLWLHNTDQKIRCETCVCIFTSINRNRSTGSRPSRLFSIMLCVCHDNRRVYGLDIYLFRLPLIQLIGLYREDHYHRVERHWKTLNAEHATYFYIYDCRSPVDWRDFVRRFRLANSTSVLLLHCTRIMRFSCLYYNRYFSVSFK